MLIKCKRVGRGLESESAPQPCRCLGATQVRLGMPTNGVIYRIFADLEELK